MFFPEGTSTDGLRVLPFKSSLFEAFFASDDACKDLWIQPVSVAFFAPPERPAAFYDGGVIWNLALISSKRSAFAAWAR